MIRYKTLFYSGISNGPADFFMTDDQKIQFKQALKQHGINIITARIEHAKQSMDNAQAAANSESKSSAGDKYETSRSMNQLEKNMHATQLAANQQELAALMTIDCSKIYDAVINGAVVETNTAMYFIAAGIGKVMFEEQTIFFLSPAAPLSKVLLQKRKNDTVIFNGKSMQIQDCY